MLVVACPGDLHGDLGRERGELLVRPDGPGGRPFDRASPAAQDTAGGLLRLVGLRRGRGRSRNVNGLGCRSRDMEARASGEC